MYLPEVIGKQGCCIKAIQDHFGVRLNVPPGASREDSTNVKIGIAGPVEKVILAKALIKEIAMYYHSEVTHPGVVHAEMPDIPSISYNLIIGSKGSEIRHIQANFKVTVQIPNANSNCKNLLVIGPPSNVEAAAAYIRKIVKQSQQEEVAAVEGFSSGHHNPEDAEEHEPWMDAYVRSSASSTSPSQQPLEATSGLTPPTASPAVVARSAWGAAVINAEGW